MRKLTIVFFIFLVYGLSAQDKHELLSLQFVNYLANSNFDEACSMFDPKVLEKIDSKSLEEIWNSLQKQKGTYKSYVDIESKQEKSFTLTHTTLVFEKGALKLRLAFGEDDKIAGIFFLPADPPQFASPPSYAKPAKFSETAFILRSGDYELPSILCEPVNVSSYPVVIFVHGSGPNDMDETIGPNKVFRDIAQGLASMGIASIRYDKRTKVYPVESMESLHFTLYDETIFDAISAVNHALRLGKADTSAVFILGHSLGGYAAPKIASKHKGVKGLIIMAGNARPLEDLIEEQINYLFMLDGEISEDERKTLELVEASLKKLRNRDFNANTPADSMLMGISVAYWEYLLAYDPLATAAKLQIPILILQGERDYQVTMKDFQLWKKTLEKNSIHSFRSFKRLNHLMMRGKGRPNPDEYMKPGNVDSKLVRIIAKWINQ